MRTKQSKVVQCGGSPFHVGFPYPSLLLADNGSLLNGSNPPVQSKILDIKRNQISSTDQFFDSTIDLYTFNGTPWDLTLSKSGIQNIPIPSGTISASQSSSVSPLDFVLPKNKISIALGSSADTTFQTNQKYRLTAAISIIHEFYQTFEASLFYSPLCFSTDESYSLHDDAPLTKVAGAGIGDIFKDMASDQQPFITPSTVFPTVDESTYISSNGHFIDLFSESSTLAVVTVPRLNWVRYKLLNRSDWDLIRTTDPVYFDKAFFEGLSSPEIWDSIDSGGAEYWGVFKFCDYPIESFEVTYSTQSESSGSGSYQSAFSLKSAVSNMEFYGKMAESLINEDITITQSAKSYKEKRDGFKVSTVKTSPTYHTPSIILRY